MQLWIFLEVLEQKGNWELFGLELSPEAAKEARKRLKSAKIYTKPIESAGFKANYFDLVTLFQTIEHVENPVRLLREARRVLKPGGVLLVATPDASGWQAKLMGTRWFSYRHLDHLLFFNYKSLFYALKQAGFKKISRLSDPAYWHRLGYLIDRVKFYLNSSFLIQSVKWLKLLLGPLLKAKVPIPLLSVVVKAEK